MKNAIIFHGTGCKPEDFWYGWLKQQLETQGISVELPHYQEINKTNIAEFLPTVLKTHTFDDDTVLIGHSAGVPLILSILESIQGAIAGVALVAGFSEQLEDNVTEPVLQPEYHWDAIKQRAGEVYIFNSPNDPWGCDDKQGRKLFDRLGGTLIIKNDGHFGSSKDPDYKEFPLLASIVRAIK